MNTQHDLVVQVMNDEEFVKSVMAMEEPSDVQAAFEEKGIHLTIEDINLIAEQVMVASADGELDEAQLAGVAGGVDPFTITAIILGVIKVGADVMTEVNKSRKAQGKKTIW